MKMKSKGLPASSLKRMTYALALLHTEAGKGAVAYEKPEGSVIVNLSKEGEIFAEEGSHIHAKKLRRFLWPLRHHRKLRRRNIVLWSAYNSDEDLSLVGIGAAVPVGVAERLKADIIQELPHG